MTINRLYLSFAAVIYALEHRTTTAEDLKQALFCCSEYEVNEAGFNDFTSFNTAMSALALARSQGRLLYAQGGCSGNPITFGEINALLEENGASLLLMAGGEDSRPLYQIPMHCGVPTTVDRSVEVLWAACPWSKNWRKSWGLEAAGDKSAAPAKTAAALQPIRPHRNQPGSPWRQALAEVSKALFAEQNGLSPEEVDITNYGSLTYLQVGRYHEGITDAEARLLLRLNIAGHVGYEVVTDKQCEFDQSERTVLVSNAQLLTGHEIHGRKRWLEPGQGVDDLIREYHQEVFEALRPRALLLEHLANLLEQQLVFDSDTWKQLLATPIPEPAA